MATIRFDPEPVDIALRAYRKNRNSANIEAIYNLLDPMITKVLHAIGDRFRKEHREDFDEMSQLVRLAMFRILALVEPEEKRLINLAADGNQLISIILSAAKFDYWDNYRAYKRGYAPRRNTNKLKEFVSTRPRRSNDYSFEDKILCGASSNKSSRIYTVLRMKSGAYKNSGGMEKHENSVVDVAVENSVENTLYAISVPKKIMEKVLELNRLNGKSAKILEFCLISMLDGKTPSPVLLAQMSGMSTSHASAFWPTYTATLIRVATMRLAES